MAEIYRRNRELEERRLKDNQLDSLIDRHVTFKKKTHKRYASQMGNNMSMEIKKQTNTSGNVDSGPDRVPSRAKSVFDTHSHKNDGE